MLDGCSLQPQDISALCMPSCGGGEVARKNPTAAGGKRLITLLQSVLLEVAAGHGENERQWPTVENYLRLHTRRHSAGHVHAAAAALACGSRVTRPPVLLQLTVYCYLQHALARARTTTSTQPAHLTPFLQRVFVNISVYSGHS